MTNYIPPSLNNLPFNFGTGGYQRPDLNNLNFRFDLRPAYSQVADLRSAINVLQIYQDSTYTYVKECRKIVIGHGNGIQTIQLPCTYGGIRDLGSYIYGNPIHKDLNSSIVVLSHTGELGSFIRPTITDTVELKSFTRSVQTDYADLTSALKALYFDSKDLGAYIRGFKGLEIPVDLGSAAYAVPPKDLNSYLNIIEIRNLTSTIVGEWWHGSTNLYSEIPTVSTRHYVGLRSALHGWDTLDLSGSITPFSYYDLTSTLIGGMFNVPKNLNSIIAPINPKDLLSSIHGWDEVNLSSLVNGVYGPGDIISYINPVSPKDLSSYIKGFKGLEITKDLLVTIIGTNTKDLFSSVGIIHPVDLNSSITATGDTRNIISTIIPKMLRVSTVFRVSLLESINLNSVINCTCWSSNYKDLNSNVYALSKKDLKSYIIGWHGNTSDNVRDLGGYINIDNYINQDTLEVNFIPVRSSDYVSLDVSYNNNHYHNIDRMDVVLTTMRIADLSSYIYGQMRSTDLNSTLSTVVPSNFTTLPEWVKPKTTEVFINLNRFEERWRRFVDLMFESIGDDKMHYFYVSGEQKVYKVDRGRKWVLWVTGYNRTDDGIVEKTSVRKKILFNLSKYVNIDDAVRDMMTLAAEFKTSELNSTINGVLPVHKDLYSNVSVKHYNKWYKHLNSTINV